MKKLILDSNIFLRYLVCDNLEQFEKAKEALNGIERGESVGLVSVLVIAEIIWVLEGYYAVKRVDFVPGLIDILSLNNIKIYEIKKVDLFEILSSLLKINADFTDIYLHHLSKKLGNNVMSFDSDFLKMSKKNL